MPNGVDNDTAAKSSAAHNLQDIFLNEVRKASMPVQIYLTNGYQVRGRVKGFDNFTIVIEGRGKEPDAVIKEQLVYKHAISTITPMKVPETPLIRGDAVAATEGKRE